MADWKQIPLGTLLTQRKEAQDIVPHLMYPLVTVSNSGQIRQREVKSGAEIQAHKGYTAKQGDFIYSRLSLHNGAFGIVPKELDNALVTGEMPCFIIDKNQIHPQILIYLMNLPDFLWQVKQLIQGVGRVRIKEEMLLRLTLTVPPIKEQKPLVEKMENFKMNYSNLGQEIARQQALLKQLRQQVLQEGIEGKLTADWRQKNKKTPAASELLERIQAEKSALIKQKKIKPQKPLPPIQDSEKPFSISKNWAWCRLGEISTYGVKISVEPKDIKDNTWILDLEDIEKGTSKLIQRMTNLDRPAKSTKSMFKKGDVMYGKLRPYLDKVIVAEEDGFCTTEIMPIHLFGQLNPYFIRLALKSKNFLEYANSQVSGMRMPRLKTESGRNALIPLPPLAEQQAIVDKVEKILALCDELEAEINRGKTTAAGLMQSVLKESFAKAGK